MAAVVVGLCAVPIVGALLTPQPALTSSNSRQASSAVGIALAPGSQHCRPNQFVAAATRHVVITIASYPAPRGPFSVEIRTPQGRIVASASGIAASVPGSLGIVLDRTITRDLQDAAVCVRNLGLGPLELASSWTSASPGARLAYNQPGEPAADDYRFDFYRADRLSPADQAGRVARRAALFRPDGFGVWTVWALAAMMLGVAAAAVALVARRSAPV